MDLEALMRCLGTGSCVVTQLTSSLIIGMLLFLIASGVTLIFGVLNITNFAHGSLYMIGAYVALTLYQASGNYFVAAIGAALAVGLLGVAFERLLMSKVYGSNVLMQLLVCYAVILICDDLVKIIWGPSGLSMGMPAEFRLPPIRFLGGVIPPFYLFMIGTAAAIGLVLWLVIERTRFGKVVRAAAVNGPMVSALGIRVNLYYAAVFGIGSALAGATGAASAVADPRHGLLDPDRILHRHGDRRHGLDRRRLRRRPADRFHALLRQHRLSPVRRRRDVPVHGAGADLQAERPVWPAAPMSKQIRHPDRSAKRGVEGPVLSMRRQKRSLGYAGLRPAPLGMTSL